MKQSNMILVGAILLGGAWLYMQRKKAKDAAAADKPVMQERISEAVVSLQGKQKAAFPLAVRKEYDIIVPPAAVSEKVWDEVALIQAEREEAMKLNIKPPLYL